MSIKVYCLKKKKNKIYLYFLFLLIRVKQENYIYVIVEFQYNTVIVKSTKCIVSEHFTIYIGMYFKVEFEKMTAYI